MMAKTRRKRKLVAVLNGVQYYAGAMWVGRRLRRAWPNAIGAGPAILLLALMPSVSYIDHWDEFSRAAMSSDSRQERDEGDVPSPHDEHEAHCHTNVAGCGNQPPADLRLLHVVVDMEEPKLVETELVRSSIRLQGFDSIVPTEPPRSLPASVDVRRTESS
jgi:hypothetical protein